MASRRPDWRDWCEPPPDWREQAWARLSRRERALAWAGTLAGLSVLLSTALGGALWLECFRAAALPWCAP